MKRNHTFRSFLWGIPLTALPTLPALAAEETATSAGGYSLGSSLVIGCVMLLAAYFIMIRPDVKRKRQLELERDSMETGDKIVTDGGMVAKVLDLTEDTVTVESGPNKTTFVILRSSVAQNRTRRSIAENERKLAKEQNKAKFTRLFKKS